MMNLPGSYPPQGAQRHPLTPFLFGRIPSNPSMAIPVSSFPSIKTGHERKAKRSESVWIVPGHTAI